MSDFGADTCDFHSDFASDFRTESDDYASDFRDFPGDFSGDFGGAPRKAKQPPEPPSPHRRISGQPPKKPQGNKDGGKLAAQAASHSTGDNATPQGHEQGAQGKRSCGGIGIAPNIKTPYTRGKRENCKKRKSTGNRCFSWG